MDAGGGIVGEGESGLGERGASAISRALMGGGGLRLVLPKEEGVLHPAQSVCGFKLVSDVQIYLGLSRAGQRGEQQEAELRQWPVFAGGLI